MVETQRLTLNLRLLVLRHILLFYYYLPISLSVVTVLFMSFITARRFSLEHWDVHILVSHSLYVMIT